MSRTRPEGPDRGGGPDGTDPPGWSTRLLRRLLPPDAVGDLEEGFRHRVKRVGPTRARRWYRSQTLRYVARLPALLLSSPNPGLRGHLDMLLKDLRFAARSLLRHPVFAGVVVFTLAVAIGANATIFSALNALFLQTVPVHEPDRVVEIYGSSDQDAEVGGTFQGYLPISHTNAMDIRDEASTLSGLFVYSQWPVSILAGTEAERAEAMFVSAEYFDVLGVQPLMGRGFRPEEDDAPGGAPFAVLTHAFWQARFAGDPDVVGRTFTMNARTYTVVGVMPEEFRGTSAGMTPDFWVPSSMFVDIPQFGAFWQSRAGRFFFAGGRLAPGRSLADARAELNAIGQRLVERYPDSNRTRTIRAIPLTESNVNPNQRDLFADAGAVLMAMVGVVLLIACLNVANLLLARALSRRRELAVRASLGAGRSRLVAQLLTEALVLFGLGGAGGLLLATWGTSLLSGLRPPLLNGSTLQVEADLTVLAFTAGVTLVAALVFGLVPALRASHTDVSSQLREGDRSSTRAGGHLRSALVTGQVALSLVALVAAGLFVRGLERGSRIDPGFRVDGLALASVDLGAQGYAQDEGLLFYRRVVEEVEAVPGVRSVGVSQLRPLTGGPLRRVMRAEEDPGRADTGLMMRVSSVDPGYFETMGIEVVRGRGIQEQDGADAQRVTVVNQHLAELFWPGEDPMGRQIRITAVEDPMTVVGVVPTGRYADLTEDPQPVLYRPVRQAYPPTATLFVRAGGDPAAVLPAVRRAVEQIDPELPLFDVEPARALVADALWNTRAITLLLTGFGLVALVLATVGIYGVVSHSVRERNREMGLRIALGADHWAVLRQAMGRALVLLLLGAGAGLVLAALVSRPLAPQLYGLSPTDPLTYGGVAGILLSVALLAAYIPARRATTVDPVETLKAQ